MLRSIGAIVAGYLTTAVLTMIAIGGIGFIFPVSLNPANTGWVIINIVYGAVLAIVGGYVTALVAQKQAIRHATILAGIILIFGILTFVLAFPHLEETGQPVWYYPALVLTSTPATIWGGYLRAQQKISNDQQTASA